MFTLKINLLVKLALMYILLRMKFERQLFPFPFSIDWLLVVGRVQLGEVHCKAGRTIRILILLQLAIWTDHEDSSIRTEPMLGDTKAIVHQVAVLVQVGGVSLGQTDGHCHVVENILQIVPH